MAYSAKMLRLLKDSKRVLVPLHLHPDADSMGSALGLKLILEGWNKKVDVVSADPLPENLLFLPKAETIKRIDPASIGRRKHSLLVLLDGNELRRFAHRDWPKWVGSIPTIIIDHHTDRTQGLKGLSLIHPEITSTAEMIFDLAKIWKTKISPKIAQCLLTGILADTGHFRYCSTTPEVLEKAAELIRYGANQNEITRYIFYSWPPAVINLWKILLKNARIKNRFLYTTLSWEETARANVEERNLSNAKAYTANELLGAIAGTKAVAIFAEEDGYVRVNLRSRTQSNVDRIATALGGGGHKRAAAFNFKGSIREAIQITTKLLSENK